MLYAFVTVQITISSLSVCSSCQQLVESYPLGEDSVYLS